jgi:hypothetical protein
MRSPTNISEYVSNAIRLASDEGIRVEEGSSLQARIRDLHTGTGWMDSLEKLYARVPGSHTVRITDGTPVPTQLKDYWMEFQTMSAKRWGTSSIDFMRFKAAREGLPLVGEIDDQLRKELVEICKRGDKTGGDLKGKIFNLFADDARRAYHASDLSTLIKNLTRCLQVDFRSNQIRGIFGLVARHILGAASIERLKRYARLARTWSSL